MFEVRSKSEIEAMSAPARARMEKFGATLSEHNVAHVVNFIEDYPEIIEAVHQLDARKETDV